MKVKRAILEFLEHRGVRVISRNSPFWSDVSASVEPAFAPILEASSPFTMTGPAAIYALFRAIQYIVRGQIPGDVVECGVYKGGSIMACGLSLEHFGDRTRKLYLYDTFAGMSEPTERDVDFLGRSPEAHLKSHEVKSMNQLAACSLEQVKRNLSTCTYPSDQFVYVQGKVEDTIPGTIPERIALLRLDTDWYESTLHELTHLFPRLSPGGVIIIDDYGIWKGAREATDTYFREQNVSILLNQIDRTGACIGVKR